MTRGNDDFRSCGAGQQDVCTCQRIWGFTAGSGRAVVFSGKELWLQSISALWQNSSSLSCYEFQSIHVESFFFPQNFQTQLLILCVLLHIWFSEVHILPYNVTILQCTNPHHKLHLSPKNPKLSFLVHFVKYSAVKKCESGSSQRWNSWELGYEQDAAFRKSSSLCMWNIWIWN